MKPRDLIYLFFISLFLTIGLMYLLSGPVDPKLVDAISKFDSSIHGEANE